MDDNDDESIHHQSENNDSAGRNSGERVMMDSILGQEQGECMEENRDEIHDEMVEDAVSIPFRLSVAENNTMMSSSSSRVNDASSTVLPHDVGTNLQSSGWLLQQLAHFHFKIHLYASLISVQIRISWKFHLLLTTCDL